MAMVAHEKYGKWDGNNVQSIGSEVLTVLYPCSLGAAESDCKKKK